MKAIPIIAFLALGYLSSASAIAQDSQASNDAKTAASMPYEIVITPRVRRADLRNLIVQVEDDFFSKFNELNMDDDYDVLCYEYVPTMSHIRERVCEPAFMIRARADNTSENTFLLGNKYTKLNAYLLQPKAMRKEVEPDYDILQEKMEDLTRSDSEFRDIGSVLAQLKARLKNFGKE